MNERRFNIFQPFRIPFYPTSTSRALQLSLYQHSRRQQLHSSLLVMALLPKEDVSATQILCQYPILVYVARKRHVSNYLFSYMFHQSRNFVPEIAIVNWTFTEGESDFLGGNITDEIGSKAFTKLVDQVVGAERGSRYILDVRTVTAPIDAQAIAYNVFHYII